MSYNKFSANSFYGELMKQVLMIQSDSPIRDYINLVLSENEDINITVLSKVSETLDYLSLAPSLDLIFIGDKVEVDADISQMTKTIVELVNSNNLKLSGSNKGIEKIENGTYIHPQAPIDRIIKHLLTIIDLDRADFANNDFVPIPIELCLKLDTIPCDIHVKLGQSDSAKYLKRFRSEQQIQREELQTYLDKDLAKLYVHNSDIEVINERFKELIQKEKYNEVNATKNEKNHSVNKYFDTMKDTLDYVHFMLDDLGIQTSSPGVFKSIVGTINKNVMELSSSKRDGLQSFFVGSLMSENNYAAKLQTLTSLLLASMLKDAKWATREMSEKVMYTTFFQDISLQGRKELLSCIDRNSLEKLRGKDRLLVETHAKAAADQLNSMGILPHGVEILLLEQHGSRNGVGFPLERSHSSKIGILIRIVSEFSVKLLNIYEAGVTEDELKSLLKEEFERDNGSNKDLYELLQDTVSGLL